MMGNIPKEACVAAVRPKPGCSAGPDPLQRVEGAEQGVPVGAAHICPQGWPAPRLAVKGGEEAPSLYPPSSGGALMRILFLL